LAFPIAKPAGGKHVTHARRFVVWFFAITTSLIAATFNRVAAQDYPVKPIRIVVAYSPGGGTDLLSRILARNLTESWGQTVIVDNRPGAGGILGTEILARAAPDGYTLSMVPSTHAINPSLFKKLPYDPIRDFATVSMVATSPNIVVVHPSLPVRSIRALIDLAKKRPGELTFASAGVGATTHLAGEYFKSMAAISARHIPYKGSGQAQIDLAGGQVHYMVDSLPSGLPNTRSGKTIALATTGKQRFVTLPEIPTVKESGLPGYESISWWGIMAPAGTPSTAIAKLQNEIARIMSLAAVKELILAQGAEPWLLGPQEFMDFVRAETTLYAKIVRDAGVKVE
jgi:tripartite-type tricarboxylate transporter receptor subunit TctC